MQIIINVMTFEIKKSSYFGRKFFEKNFCFQTFCHFFIVLDAELWEMRKNNVFHASHFLAYLLMSCVLMSSVLMSRVPVSSVLMSRVLISSVLMSRVLIAS